MKHCAYLFYYKKMLEVSRLFGFIFSSKELCLIICSYIPNCREYNPLKNRYKRRGVYRHICCLRVRLIIPVLVACKLLTSLFH